MKDFIAPVSKYKNEVQELQEKFNGINGNSIRKKLNKLIKEDPHCIEAYNLRFDIYMHEDHLTATTQRSQKSIFGSNRNNSR